MKKNLLTLLAGLLFGAGLALSGMTDPSRVIGFLDLAGEWDPTLAFVMAGALLVFSTGYFFLRKKCRLPGNESDSVSKKLILGAILFGVGWGLGGFCPGPAIANLAALRTEALIFVPMMAVGMFLAQRLCGVDR
ncbi:MAG: hypothetical protein P1U86_08705 [Verrucomicrobiales bacterium]|nr:hypothetical protein [Verrucomicrobiales bacterium]